MIQINWIKKLTIITLLSQGILMSANLSQLKVNNTEVPFIFEEDKNLPIVSMQLIFKNSGSLSDTKDGLVQLSAALLNEGTKKDGSIGFATKLENRAISLGTHAGKETFVIEVGSLKEEFPYAIERLKELLQDPNYTEKTLEKIKTQVIGTLKRKESDFDYISGLELKKMLFPNTPLAKASAGTVESVESIRLVDIDKHLGDHLGVDNAIVVMGGDISEKEASKFASATLTLLSNVSSTKLETMKALGKKQVKEKILKSEQAYVYFGAPLDIAYDSKERHLAQVASFVLGSSGFGSRMMEEIRVKKGLAYSAYSRFNINKTHSYFSGYLQTKIETGDEAVASVKEVVNTFLDKGISQEELTAAQQFILGSEPLRNETLSQRLGRAFQEFYTNKPLGSATENLKKIEAIKLSEINAFIKEHKEIAELSFSVVTGKKK
ncbi:MAG: Zinc protease-like protein [uncultured Sulfurovum sp.]|uniref:Zinc protease-like protein n=1 Tax=uncultured Sulfurovum sp. TaxID=269237 RepID=A0A6S6T952_9BACT|nr:MAG: Zinc protease-like protein [uncultured Sulfurovum sp.]